ncbi:MAG: bifunctional phosphopantothenoylcysteine decarboxylase/phosphopantothenate--cysteine ligase CoaBC [Bacteroidales bacterium]|nr:bifunctional phosphopantothenoylcysteine decarboxylase/phosphopantothenate--cysteine ligase CoaBC [Bacteroidales bacterium]
MMLKGKKIIVGISGGIAAYKAPLLVRMLIKEGAEVRCVVTEHALRFVTVLTLETVSQNKVYSDLFAPANDHTTEHISLKDWGDAMVVAPATANVIGKLASGIGDDALSTLLLSFRKPLFLCPAMNTQMLECPSVQRNLGSLRGEGVNIIEPTAGELACGTVGKGRMEEPEEIVRRMEQVLNPAPGRRVLVTAGPTYERIDSVRFVGNFSTGKMGFAVAEELAERGMEVVLVAGPTSLSTGHPLIRRIDVESAQQMYDACIGEFPRCDAAVLTAAVADFRPEHAADIKIKKQEGQEGLTLHLVQNPDILAALGAMKTEGQRLVGFALETNDEVVHAQAKLEKKNLDFIVLNSLRDKGAGFGCDTNKVTFLHRDGRVEEGSLKSKRAVAKDIADRLFEN